MGLAKEHEPPEVIAAFIAERLLHVRSYVLSNNEQVRAHGLKLLRMVCRAARHGRMPKEMRQRYEGILKDLRPHIMALHRTGHSVPNEAVLEIERVRSKSRGSG